MQRGENLWVDGVSSKSLGGRKGFDDEIGVFSRSCSSIDKRSEHVSKQSEAQLQTGCYVPRPFQVLLV